MYTIYSCHNEPDLGGVSRAREMSIDLLGFVLVEADESVQNIVTSGSIVVPALIIREVVLHGANWKLLLESINLV